MSTTSITASPTKEKYHALLSSAIKTAGSDNWKVAAGRIGGSDSFELGDAWRILKLNFKSTSKPITCPVCLDTPKSSDDWYITKSCRHAVCKECLQNYAANLISDPNHHGPLLCPCCPRQLRVQDAKVALDRQYTIKPRQHKSIKKIAPKVMKRSSSKRQKEGGLFADEINSESINNSALEHLLQWDTKTRDEYLRSMSDFRPCPHCSQGKTNDDTGVKDNKSSTSKHHMTGGFVTPECLAPMNEDREKKAEYLLRLASGGPGSILLVYIIYYMICAGRSTTQPTGDILSAILQIMMALVPSVLVPIVPHLIRLLLSRLARRVIIQPVTVTCPCCEKDFQLLASSEFEPVSSDASESATEQWKDSNTRPCPQCSSPILKDGGCNHVKCVRCRADFCWACMKLRSRCQAYKCKNNAPYSNAFGDGSLNAVVSGLNALERERQEGRTLMERIDNAEAQALNNLSLIRNPLRFAAAVGTLCITASFLNPQSTLWSTMSRSLSLVVRMLRRMILLFTDSFIYVSTRLICALVLFEVIAQYTGQRPNFGGANRQAEGIRGDGHQQNRGRGFVALYCQDKSLQMI